ncbi:MAG: RNA methyltransferase [Methanobacteriota archaeon]|nr:MAG: RNA methyltransferase [Euryarchaeota archaeon]
MAEICVVLVEPKHQCNVGFVARAMKNFGLSRLYFSGSEFTPAQKAFDCAAHARDVLMGAENLGDRPLNDLFDVVIGTTAKPHPRESSPRSAIGPGELAERLREVGGRAALLFGREDSGLSNEELDACDMVVSIPGNPDYPTLNISHAAAILFYELAAAADQTVEEARKAEGVEKEAVLARLGTLLETMGYPKYKSRVVERIFRRVMGRACISGREAHTLAGVFKEADDEIKRRRKRRR